jgi:phytoene dehydrogenase-like protein
MPPALDKTYDGIIVGAGHHGLVLGSYLADFVAKVGDGKS